MTADRSAVPVQLWVCGHCSQTYWSDVVLSEARHHCPSVRSSRVRPYILQFKAEGVTS